MLLALLSAAAPSGLHGQIRRGRAAQSAAPTSWAPVAVGVYAGYDDASRAQLVAGRLFLPLLRNGRVQALPSAEITFLTGAREYQYSAEIVYMSRGREGGLFIGGGLGHRDSVVDATPGDPRNTFLTYSAIAGLRGGLNDRVQVELQVHRIWLKDVIARYRPISFALGASLTLWR